MKPRLEIGTVFERIFQIYKDQFSLLIPAALLVFVPVAILNGFLYDEGGVLLTLIAAVVSVVATYWYQGTVVRAAEDIEVDGKRDHTIGSLFGSVTPVLGSLIVAGILAGIAIGIGLLLLIVPGLFLMTIWAVLAPVIVVERTGAFGSFGRSAHLTKGSRWAVFGVIVILFLILFVFGLVVQAIAIGISDSIVGFAISSLIANVVVAPLQALAAAVMYFRLKQIEDAPAAAPQAIVEDTGPAPSPTQPMPPPPESPAGGGSSA